MRFYKFKTKYLQFLQKFFGVPLKIKESWENTPISLNEMVAFQDWFDSTDSIENCLQKAKVDWNYRFVKFPYFKKISKGVALEIGFGGGRLIAQSAKIFKKVYGIDIHKNFKMTQFFLDSLKIKNYKLLHRDEILNIASSSVDYVYSFIVFQHFNGIGEIDFYLKQIKRLLKKNGVAHIYFGKNKDQGVSLTGEDKFKLRDSSLFISPSIMISKIKSNFEVIDFSENLHRDPILNKGESMQAMVVFKKII